MKSLFSNWSLTERALTPPVSFVATVTRALMVGDVDDSHAIAVDREEETLEAWELVQLLDECGRFPLHEQDALSSVRRMFDDADVETTFEAVAMFLQTSVQVRERVVVVEPSTSTAVDLLTDKVEKIGSNVAWGRILGLDVRLVLSFLESTAGLDQNHAFHRDNLVPILVRRALDLAPERRGIILDRLCGRGYSPQVVRTLVYLYKAMPTASLPGVLEHFPGTGQGTRPFVTELLYQAAALEPVGDRLSAFSTFLPVTAHAILQVRIQLDALLTSARLGGSSVELLVDYLGRIVGKDALVTALEKAVGVWGGPSAANILSPYQQKVLANFVVRSFSLLSRVELEQRGDLVPMVLKGISLYLESPLPSVRKVGMCVGNALSAVLSKNGDGSSAVIFPDGDLDDAIRLDWPDGSDGIHRELREDGGTQKTNESRRLRVIINDAQNALDREPDSDDESTDSEFGYREDLVELDQGETEQNYSVQQIVKMLGGGEDNWKEQLEALEAAEGLVKASPDELRLYVEPLAKGLMFTRLPAWSQDDKFDINDESSVHEQRRMDSMLALVLELPEAAGSAMVDAFYSSGSNIEHRTKALQILSTGAKELRLSEKGCILDWSAKLLSSVDKPRHGVDLLGRDSYLLGCLLCTLGNFMESCAGTMDALYLGTAVIKLVLSDGVVAGMKREKFVLRSGLAAAARAISSVPPAAIATTMADHMLPRGNSGVASRNAVSNVFVALLFRTKTLFEDIAKDSHGGTDKTTLALCQGGLNFVHLLVIDSLEEHTQRERLIQDPGEVVTRVESDDRTQIRVPPAVDLFL